MKNTVPQIARQFTSHEYIANIVSKANGNFNRDGFARSKTICSTAVCSRVASFSPRNVATRRTEPQRNSGNDGFSFKKFRSDPFHLEVDRT